MYRPDGGFEAADVEVAGTRSAVVVVAARALPKNSHLTPETTMTPLDSKEELVRLLGDLYSMELQALAQMRSAPDLADDQRISADFRMHCAETEIHADLVRGRLEAHGGSPSTIKDAVMRLGGKGMLLFAKLQTETPGRLVTHAYSYEAMEWAAYAALARLAELAGDPATVDTADHIQSEERAMMERLERAFDTVEHLAHAEVRPDAMADHLGKHLAEAHAFEVQSEELLRKAVELAGSEETRQVYIDHLEETRAQKADVEARLHELNTDVSWIQDAALRLGAFNWSAFFRMQKDTPAKLAVFTYAVEHLEIGAYELLARTARRAGDSETASLCRRILDQERSTARRIASSISAAVEATLAEAR